MLGAELFDTVLQALGVVLGAAILYMLQRARRHLERRNNKLDQRTAKTASEVEQINRAVNHHPPENPTLYTMVETLGHKVDQGFARNDRRLDGIDARVSGIDTRIAAHDEALQEIRDQRA